MITFDVVWCRASWRWCLCCPLIPALFISLRSPKVSTVTRLQVVQPQHYAKFVCVIFEHQELENVRLVLRVKWSNILNSSQWDREIFGDRKKLLSNCRVSEESPEIWGKRCLFDFNECFGLAVPSIHLKEQCQINSRRRSWQIPPNIPSSWSKTIWRSDLSLWFITLPWAP